MRLLVVVMPAEAVAVVVVEDVVVVAVVELGRKVVGVGAEQREDIPVVHDLILWMKRICLR